MNIIKLYQDFNIQYTPEGEGHHAGHGWVSTNCPFCDDPSDHLGYNMQENYFNCFRCGWHRREETVARLLNVSEQEAFSIILQYGGTRGQRSLTRISPDPRTVIHTERPASLPLPSGTSALTPLHRIYLKGRRFNPDQLEEEWGLMGTGPVAPLGTVDYKYRIIAPIYWQGRMVSFQTRDVTGHQDPKYMFCPSELEIIPNANLLYMRETITQHDGGRGHHGKLPIGICVEGITDVWRLGRHAFATFGTGVTTGQIRLISELFERVAVVFDQEPQAQLKARQLVSELYFRGVEARSYSVGDDPASMSQGNADSFVKTILNQMEVTR